ncbi:hypothetical protein AWZ03_007711 [Drosophila navojoa]|uniref:Uncharacterized protein n=1 Tax=Drosophila navojoa TaxID=7232 RepID=A0A484BAH6_DRONA|nr:hypothetical protein AWZ03_007711 [Drosophila navojoa]
MRRLNTVCKTRPFSAACDHWQREICTRCPDWKHGQDGHHINIRSASAGHRLITMEECQRLKRDLQASLFAHTPGLNSMSYVLIFFLLTFFMSLIIWLLAKAFVLKKPPPCPDDCADDRQSGGQASVDDLMQQMRDKCNASSRMVGCMDSKALYVPTRFWDSFSAKRFGRKPAKSVEPNYELQVNTSEETSDLESSGCRTEDSKGNSTDEEIPSTSSEQSERDTPDEDETSITMDIQSEANRCYDSISRMPTTYEPLATNQGRRKMRWTSWLRRGKQYDNQV